MVKIHDVVTQNTNKLEKAQHILKILLQYFPTHQLCYHMVAMRDIFCISKQGLETGQFVTHKSDGAVLEITFGIATPTPKDTRGFFQKMIESAPVANVIGKITIQFNSKSTNPCEVHIETYGQDNLPIWKRAASDLESVIGSDKVRISTIYQLPIKVG